MVNRRDGESARGTRRGAVIAVWAAGTLLASLAAVPVGGAPAGAESNGVGATPAMGWSTWSFVRRDPTAATVEAQARALVSSGLAKLGYDYVNLDDFWYVCPGSQGPSVDSFGRWVTDTSKFPNSGSTNGIQAVASYVHGLGLKFGLYVTPGISDQAVAQNTPIMGTSDTAAEIADGAGENNYNCHGMQGIDYSKPGAQQFINSWADEFAAWGVDYVKLDGVGAGDIGDVQAWSQALQQTGRPIHLELSNNLAQSDATTWEQYSNGWRTGGDIECYCGANGSSYPLTDWGNVSARFSQVASWQPYGQPGAWNDYDSIEVGNGGNDGITAPERQTQLSLWALASAPFILGTDLTHLSSGDLSLLKNTSVIAVDQDQIDADRLIDTGSEQVFDKREPGGSFVLGVFNTDTSASHSFSVPLAQAGIQGSATLTNLWTGASMGTTATLTTTVPAGGVTLVRATPTSVINGGFELLGKQSGKCLDIQGVSFLPGTQAEIYSCNGGINQEFSLTSAGELRTMGATECLDVFNNETAPGTKVELWPCNGGANQKWTLNANGTITGQQSGLCLDVAGQGTANTTKVDIYSCNGQANQVWAKQ